MRQTLAERKVPLDFKNMKIVINKFLRTTKTLQLFKVCLTDERVSLIL